MSATREGKKCVAGYFDADLARALKMHALKRDMKLEAVLVEIYTEYLDRAEPGWRQSSPS